MRRRRVREAFALGGFARDGRTAFAAEFELRWVLGATFWADGLERRTVAAAEFSGLRILGIATWAAHFSPTQAAVPNSLLPRSGAQGVNGHTGNGLR